MHAFETAKQQFSDFRQRVQADCLPGSEKSLFNFTEVRWDTASLALVNDTEDRIRITFESAWGPPEDWLGKMREQYEELTFRMDFDDGMGTSGQL